MNNKQNCRVGQKYPSAPGVVPAQSKAIFKIPDCAGISHPLQKMFELANLKMPVMKMVKPCPNGGVCVPGGGHGSIEWCEKCNQVI